MTKQKSSPLNQFVHYPHGDSFSNWLEYEVTSTGHASEGPSVIRMPIQEKHISPAGTLHGGILSALFDIGFGVCVFSKLSKEDWCATLEMKVQFLKPIRLKDVLTIETTAVFEGRSIIALQAFGYVEGSEGAVAMSSGTFILKRAEKTMKKPNFKE